MEALIKLEKIIKEIEALHNKNIHEVEQMQQSYITAIGNISDSAILLLTETLKYIEVYQEYGGTEEELYERITTFIDEVRNLEYKLKNAK